MVTGNGRVITFNDVALREEGQVAGGALSPSDQKEYVRLLMRAGVNGIEVGFPASSREQLQQCKNIVAWVQSLSQNHGLRRPLLGGLARAKEEDILAVKEAGLDTCHIYTPASPEFISAMFSSDKYGKSKEDKQNWIIRNAVAMIVYAKSLGFQIVQYSPEDAARADLKFLKRLILAVAEAGADVVNITDTTGLRTGNEFGDLVKSVKDLLPGYHTLISVHCHNDSDHSTHNALQAILAGADIVEGSFYGLGERSGMTKFEAIAMNIATRRDIFGGISQDLDIQFCYEIVHFIANALGMPVPRHWVVVGGQNAIISSGTHQSVEARSSGQSGYYSWQPESFGHGSVSIAITQSSGKDGLRAKAKGLGYDLSDEELDKANVHVKRLAEARRGQPLSDAEIVAIIRGFVSTPHKLIVKRCQVVGGVGTIPTAVVTLTDCRGREHTSSKTGSGPFDAVMLAVACSASKAYGFLTSATVILQDFNINSLGAGQESMADAYVSILVQYSEDKLSNIYVGRSFDNDTIQAVAQAFADAISLHLTSVAE